MKTKLPYITSKRSNHIPISVIQEADFKGWLGKQDAAVRRLAAETGFEGKGGSILVVRGDKAAKIYAALGKEPSLLESASVMSGIQGFYAGAFLKTASFELKGLKGRALEIFCTGWGLAAYRFERYRKDGDVRPALVWPAGVDKKRVQSAVEAAALVRDLVNTPTIDFGPQQLEDAARGVADQFKAKVKVVKGKALEKGFPLVHAVGMAAGKGREPRLIELRWGKAKDPALTLVGKGVCFDTGGLDMKPSQFMRYMKKDMGGAAHALALGRMIMGAGLRVNLRILIPAVENAISGESFRPGDVFISRSGKSVENTDTDAEGRLILADTLTYASEEKTDLILDFATLTGSARAALGLDIPAAFTNDDGLRGQLADVSGAAEDLVWPMPLHAPYLKRLESDIADTTNNASVPGDLIYSALFLQQFLKGTPRWVHLDCYAWENFGSALCPKGGKDTGLRGMYALVEKLYG